MACPKRNGFTLIELLVVIAIIGILIGLAAYGVMVVRGRDSVATTNVELSEFRAGLERFKATYGGYPPSQLTISQNSVDDQLKRFWPNLATDAFSKWPGLAGPVTLQGDQCLVLLLGGYQAGSSCLGFSQSKVRPFDPPDPTKPEAREQPLFKFKSARLVQRNGSAFFSYADPFNNAPGPGSMCYAYFCPTQTGYNPAHCNTMMDIQDANKNPTSNYPQPYKDNVGYINKQSYQILSAGKDNFWGGAHQWVQGKGIVDTANDPKGCSSDNMTNFSDGVLSGS